MKKVSVVIPVYNVEKYLEECLKSILNQTLKDIEIICVNDGSTDRSGQILEIYKKLDQRIKIIHKKNGGQSSARNAGMRQAGGKYLYFLDADDRLNKDALRLLYEEAEKKALDVLYFEGASFWETSALKKSHSEMKYDCDRGELFLPVLSGQEMMAEMVARKKYLVSVCLQFICRRFLDEEGITFYEGIIQEDNLFTFQVMMKAGRTECLGNKLFYRRIRKNSTMTSIKDERNCRGYYICYIEILKNVLNSQKESNYALQEAQAEILKELLYSIRTVYRKLARPQKKRLLKSCMPIEGYLLHTWIQPLNTVQKLVRMFKSNGIQFTLWAAADRIVRKR